MILQMIAAFWFMFLMYIVAMAYKRATRERGKLHWFVRVAVVPPIVAAWLIDVLFNKTLGYLLGRGHTTLSSNFKHIRRSGATGWRRKVANWFCENLLNPFDPDGEGHC